MTVREQGYTHWDGKLKDSRFPWWPVTRTGLRLTFKKKFFKFFFAMTLVPAVVYLVGVYIAERIEDFHFMVQGSSKILEVNPGYFKSYFTNDSLIFLMVMILVFVGAGLISDDLRHNALQLYFSRPIQKKDYLLGKSSVIMSFLFAVTLLPGMVLFLMKLVFSGSFRFLAAYPWLPLAIIGYSCFVTAFFALYSLCLSSLSKNRRYVAILTFGVYLFSDILFGIFFGIFRSPYFSLFSLKANIQQVGAALFHQKPPYSVPWVFSLVILCGIGVLAAVVIQKRVRGVEIVK